MKNKIDKQKLDNIFDKIEFYIKVVELYKKVKEYKNFDEKIESILCEISTLHESFMGIMTETSLEAIDMENQRWEKLAFGDDKTFHKNIINAGNIYQIEEEPIDIISANNIIQTMFRKVDSSNTNGEL